MIEGEWFREPYHKDPLETLVRLILCSTPNEKTGHESCIFHTESLLIKRPYWDSPTQKNNRVRVYRF